jgi:drug/metabolite transporter (DMT)-like permease
VFAFLFLGEALKFYEVLGLISLIAGTYILESKNLKEILFPLNVFIKSKYHQYIIAALLLFTASSVMDKLLVAKMNLTPISFTAFQHVFFALLLFIIYFAFKGKLVDHSPRVNKSDVLWILLISVLTIGYRYTQIVSISIASVALTLAVKRTSVLWATVIGGKIFKDTNLLKKTIAVLFILLGAILILRD